MKRGVIEAVMVVGALSSSAWAGVARADGDEQHGETYRRTGRGVGVATAGVGLSGRRPGMPAEPVTSGDLVIDDVPDGATVVQAYLYWMIYSTESDDIVSLGGTEVSAPIIGTSADTCWEAPYDVLPNHVHRADVTDIVDGNGTYTITGFPSGLAASDTQGAALVVLYEDPADDLSGTVLLMDGAITVRPGQEGLGAFTGLTVPEGVVSATWHLAVGDGESVGFDGALAFDGVTLAAPSDSMHWASRAGRYWDIGAYDVTDRVVAGDSDIAWRQGFQSDCVVLALTMLELRSPGGPDVDASMTDGGTPALDSGAPFDGGVPAPDAPWAIDAFTGDVGTTPPASTGGCGCRAATPGSSSALALLAAVAAVARRARRRRR